MQNNSVIIEEYLVKDVDLLIVRDDLFPFVGGGSKARKVIEYEKYIKQWNYNAVVTCGGVQSNHNRAVALMSAKNQWKCYLCVHGNRERFETEKGNALLCRLSGAEYDVMDPSLISVSMDQAMERLKEEGYRPYYIHGGGHDLPGGTCFVDAIVELKRQCDLIGYKPDFIFHASGTGSTQAGIMVGCEMVGWEDVVVVGISVARQYEKGKKVIADFANMLAANYGITKSFEDRVVFITDYISGGYERSSPEMDSFLKNIMKSTGLIFDSTYSGKGFYGMMDIIKKKSLYNKNIIFWHTGGLMDMMS